MDQSLNIHGNRIEGLLIDLDGVLYVGHTAVPGAAETVERIRDRGIPMRFITNTTTKPRSTLIAQLADLGFLVEAHELLTAPMVAVQYLRTKGNPRCKFLLNDSVLEDFEEFEKSGNHADAVVIGDIGDAWNYDLLNGAFRVVMDGAELIALHRNKFWETANGLRMDIGAFVVGLEYATGTKATIIGKPSAEFFDIAVRNLNVARDRIAMIGDDVDSDVGGAQRSGLLGILVKTGKYRSDYVAGSGVTPDATLGSVADLGNYFNG